MKNLKQLVLPCYKLELAMTVEAWYFLHGSTDGVCNLAFFISLLSKMTVSEGTNTKRGLSYALHPGQADSSMLALAKEWGIGRKAVARLLEDFSERGLIRVDSNPVTSIMDMVCVKSWMIAGRLIENPKHRQTVKAYEGVRIFLFNGQRLETLRRSSPRKRKGKPSEETETAAPTAVTATESVEENTATDADNTPVLEYGNALPVSKDWKQAQE